MQIIHLDRNENQYGPAPECLQALLEIDSKQISEYSRDFEAGIKSPLSKRLADEYGIEESNVMLGYGAEDILKQTIHCYVHKGDKIMIPSYSWWYYKKIADEVEGIKIEYPIVEGEDGFYYDIKAMIECYEEHKPKLVLISSPNNPTGNRLELSQLKTLLSKMSDSVVVVDEAYTLFYNSDKSYLKEIINSSPNVLFIRTFSKYYGLAGARIGFAFMGQKLSQLSTYSARYLGYQRISEMLALSALDATYYYDEIREKMAGDMDMFKGEFNALPGFRAYPSYANFILVKIPIELKEGLKNFLTNRNMIVKFMAEDGLNNHMRITIGTQEQNKMLMQLIKDYLSEINLK